MTHGRDWDDLADELGVAAVAEGEPTRWYDELWSAAGRGEVALPWDRTDPHDLLADVRRGHGDGTGTRAVVVGAGYGADAEHLAALGWTTTAFDISAGGGRRGPRALPRQRGRLPRRRPARPARRPGRRLRPGRRDLHDPGAARLAARGRGRPAYARLVAPGGTLFVVQIVREDDEEVGAEPPWLLDRAEMAALAGDGLVAESLDRLPNPTVPEARDRWRMVLTRR